MSQNAAIGAHRRAFTLIELAIVIAVVGLFAVSAIPAMDTLTQTRRLSAVREVERRLVTMRATAIATGQPAGIAVDTGEQTLQGVTIAPGGGPPVAITAATGEPEAPLSMPAEFPGVEITGLLSGDGLGADTTLWFSFEGEPQLRAGDGSLLGGFSQDAWIELTGGGKVHIRRGSGLIER